MLCVGEKSVSQSATAETASLLSILVRAQLLQPHELQHAPQLVGAIEAIHLPGPSPIPSALSAILCLLRPLRICSAHAGVRGVIGLFIFVLLALLLDTLRDLFW